MANRHVTLDMHMFLDKVDASNLPKERKEWYYKQVNIMLNENDDVFYFPNMIRLNKVLKEEIEDYERKRQARTLKGVLSRAVQAVQSASNF